MIDESREWDFFISHASADKESVAIPLATMLTGAGYRVWLDVLELKVGQSLRAKIDEGLAKSHVGVVILSSAFFEQRWTSAELGGLFARDVDDVQRFILPVWDGIGRHEVLRYSPMLADRFAAKTDKGIFPVALSLILASQPRLKLAGRNVTAHLREMLNREASTAEIGEFLTLNRRVLRSATGLIGLKFHVFYKPVFVDVEPPVDFVMQSEVSTQSEGMYGSLALGPLANESIFSSEGLCDPVRQLVSSVERVTAILRRRGRQSRHCPGFLALGRRHLLSPSMKDTLARFSNESLSLRTYDWLLEAAVASETCFPEHMFGYMAIGTSFS